MLAGMKSLLQDRKGTVLVTLAAGMVALLGLVAIVSDVGLLYLNRVRLVNGVDAAALAGVAELPAADKAVTTASHYAAVNGIDPARLEIVVADDEASLTVRSRRRVPLFWARVLGFREAQVAAGATAATEALTGYQGVFPLGVEWEDFEYGVQYRLKNGGGGGTKGNYGALALGGRGANNYRENLANCYCNWLRVGREGRVELVETEPGNMSGPTSDGVRRRIQACTHNPPCTFDNYHPDCPRIVVLPVVEGILQGRSLVKVVGFTAFFLEGVGGSGVDNYVLGRFIQIVREGESAPDQNSYGIEAAKLIR